jgi:hypothetical protein
MGMIASEGVLILFIVLYLGDMIYLFIDFLYTHQLMHFLGPLFRVPLYNLYILRDRLDLIFNLRFVKFYLEMEFIIRNINLHTRLHILMRSIMH